VLVYRAGLLSGLGHNHVIASHDLSGILECDEQLENTRVEMSFAVDSLVVDATDDRKLEGADFAKQVSAKDIGNTRKNMLSRKLLDAINQPLIRIQTTSVEGDIASLLVSADVTVAGRTNSISFAASATLSGEEIIVSGNASVSHKDLGLKRFSAAFGTLKVHENMTIRFEIVATPEL